MVEDIAWRIMTVEDKVRFPKISYPENCKILSSPICVTFAQILHSDGA